MQAQLLNLSIVDCNHTGCTIGLGLDPVSYETDDLSRNTLESRATGNFYLSQVQNSVFE